MPEAHGVFLTSTAKLIADLESRGIVLFLVNGALRYRSPKDALTDADRADLRGRRMEIVSFLTARDAARALRNVHSVQGPLTASIVQEMWWRFGGGPHEGQPVALNIIMVGEFQDVTATELTRAVREVIERHETLRTHITIRGEQLLLNLNPIETLRVEQEDLSALNPAEARAAAEERARQFCTPLNPVEGQWLIRAKVIGLPAGKAIAALSASHIVTDAGSRNIVLEEIQESLDRRRGLAVPERPSSMDYNAFSLGERAFLESAQGSALIAYWRDWYRAQPVLHAPSCGKPLLWGTGTRILCNFTIPRRVLDAVRAVADRLGATPFFVHLTIFSLALARWSGTRDFPIRILGDKRSTMALARTVGLMYCADAVDIHAPDVDFATILRGTIRAYDCALSLRVPSLHYYPPQCVRPGIEALDTSNKIPAVFNYYAGGTARERRDAEAAPDTTAAMAWPPQMTRITQTWTRPSAPLFLHLSDQGNEMLASLHFYADVVGADDQQSFIDTLFQVFQEVVPV